MQDPEGSGLGPALNKALRAISEAARAPWTLLRPGARVLPVVMEADDDEASGAPTRERTPMPEPRRRTPSDAASQAPTREGTPAPERRRRTPTPGPRPAMIPEAVPESEPRPRRRRRAAQPEPALEEGEANWRRPLDPALAERTRPTRARILIPPAALALVRRARAWRAKGWANPTRITPAAYDAVDAQARFGLIECTGGDRPQPWPGQTLLLAHTPRKADPAALLDLRPGDTLNVLSTRPGAEGWASLRVQFVTRARYVAPGRRATSLALGVGADEWAHALGGTPPAAAEERDAPAPARPREPPARGGRI